MKALVGAFNQEKALVGAFSVIVKTGCGTDGSFYSTTQDPRPVSSPGLGGQPGGGEAAGGRPQQQTAARPAAGGREVRADRHAGALLLLTLD